MLIDRYPVEDVFALVPEVAAQTDPVLKTLDTLLADDELYQAVRTDLGKRYQLTDHRWSIHDLLFFKVVPLAWVEPKRRGRPRRNATAGHPLVPEHPAHLRPLLRLRKGALHAVTG